VGHSSETELAPNISHNKLIGCGASGAYAPGPDEEEKEEETPVSSGRISIASDSEQISSVINV
jgi:hypothetical protein